MDEELIYKKTASRADTAGQDYEVKMSALMFMRGLRTRHQFFMASNVDGVGKFDDIVFIYEDKGKFSTLLVQLKHKQNPERIRNDDVSPELLSLSGKMSVPIYCQSYREVQNWFTNSRICQNINNKQSVLRIENAELVLFTNKKLRTNTERSDKNELLFTRGNVFSFSEERDAIVYSLFSELVEYGLLLNNLAKVKNEAIKVGNKLKNKGIKKKCQTLVSLLGKLDNDVENWSSMKIFYTKFLEKFRLYCEQADESSLNDFIKTEIKNVCGTTDAETKVVFEYLLKEIRSWWDEKVYYLTEKADFWEEIMQFRIQALNDSWLKSVGNFDIRFSEEETCKFKKLILNHTTVKIVTECVVLSALKVLQSLKDTSHLIVNSETLQYREQEVLCLWGRWYSVLIIVDGTADVVLDHPEKKLVFLSSCNKNREVDATLYDHLKLDHLNTTSMQVILETEVQFQGYEIPLQAITRDIARLETKLNGSYILSLLENKRVVCKALSTQQPFYISRDLLYTHSVLSEIFNTCNIPICVTLCDISLNKLRDFLPSDKKIVTFQEYIKYRQKCSYIIITEECEFSQVAEIHKMTHWFSIGNNVVWKKSKGDISILRTFLNDYSSVIENVNSVEDVPNKVTVVSAEPGMGKSTLLTHIALGTKVVHPDMYVIRLNLNLFDNQISKLPENLELEDVVKFLLEVSEVETEWKGLFEEKLKIMDNICILFDGYDEIKFIHSEKILRMLTLLQATQIQKLWVTTRPTKKNDLEEALCVLAFTLRPFSEQDKRKFLLMYWKHLNVDESVLNEFITQLLAITARNLNDRDRELTEIPLQALLLAEVFENDLKEYEDNVKKCKGKARVNLSKKCDLLNLFRHFVDRKWGIYCSKFKIQNMFHLYNNFIEQHMCTALLALFTESDIDTLNISQCGGIRETSKTLINHTKKGHQTTGIIMEISEANRPVFVHKTFSEYFVALWFKERFYKDSNVKRYLETLLFHKDFQVVRNFFDRLLFEDFELHNIVCRQNIEDIELFSSIANKANEKDQGGRTALHIAIMNFLDVNVSNDKRMEIVKSLLKFGWDVKIEDTVLHWRPLRYLDKIINTYNCDRCTYKSDILHVLISVMDSMLLKAENYSDLIETKGNLDSPDYLKSLVKISIVHGLKNVVAFMLENGMDANYEIKDVSSTTNHSGDQVKLCSCTLLHAAYDHNQFDIMELLIVKGGNINHFSSEKKLTVLHMACIDDKEDYINLLKSNGADINIQDPNGETVLHRATRSNNIELFNKLIERGADINVEDKFGNTVLHYAVLDERLDSVMHFLSLNADIAKRNEKGENVLHIAAALGNTELIELFLERGVDLNCYNNTGYTPLFSAIRNGKLEAVNMLLNSKSNREICDVNENSAMHIAVLSENEDIVKLLLKCKLELNNLNRDKKTPLQVAVSMKCEMSIINELLKNGASVNNQDIDGNTVLHDASKINYKDAFEVLLEHKGSLEIKNGEGKTPLDCIPWDTRN